MGSDHKKDKHKEKHKHKDKEKDKEKKRKREKEGEGDGSKQQHKAAEATPRAEKHASAGKKASEAHVAPTPGAGDTAGKAKKHKSSAAAGDGGSSGALAAAAAKQQQSPASGGARPAPNPAAPTFDPLRDGDKTLASFRGAKPAGGPDQLQPCWQLEGAAPAAARPLAPIQRVLDGKAELWVLQRRQMEADALDGRVLTVDGKLLAHPERPGVLGRLEIGDAAAAELELVRSYALRQESAPAAAPLFVAAPTERAAGALEPLRPTRRLVVAEDVPAANTALVARAHAEAPELQFYPEPMPPARANALLQAEGRFASPPAAPPAGTWPPAAWHPAAALLERDRRRAARKQRGLPEVDPRDDLEQQQLTDLRPAPGAPWGCAGGRPLPPQWRALPGAEGARAAALGDVEQDVSVAYVYG